MKICVVGAGAIGGLMGAKLALAGEQVTLIDVGPHLDAIKKNGLKVVGPDGTEEVADNFVMATSSMAEAGPQDMVILSLKTQVIESVVKDMRALYGPDTMVVPVQNGLPWWYFQKHGGEYENNRIKTVDPHGVIADNIEPERIIGCVVYPAGEVTAPGVIHHVEGNRFPVGELDGSETERVTRVAECFNNAGFKSFVLDNIRSEIWLKLWGNLSFNPISALSHATLVDICQFPLTRELAARMMEEAQDIADRLGITFRVPLEKRIEGAEKVGKHKTSMLQDVEAGRSLELDALIGAVIELGHLTKTPTPHIDAVFSLVKLLDKTMADQDGLVKVQKIA
ncbi:MAG: 2-dehydropantoate 2-reductase [SAR324 cluster bacterium]|nr:2-dehydropantoate 2-reductase [SAR324 cluster bacterium]